MTDLDQRYSEQLMALHHAVSQASTNNRIGTEDVYPWSSTITAFYIRRPGN